MLWMRSNNRGFEKSTGPCDLVLASILDGSRLKDMTNQIMTLTETLQSLQAARLDARRFGDSLAEIRVFHRDPYVSGSNVVIALNIATDDCSVDAVRAAIKAAQNKNRKQTASLRRVIR